jgi:dTDP-4-amino-4,6-dideoxygalactose transaminase
VGLYGILRALGVGEGDEVLVPVPTHIVVPNAVRYTGARPVYVDCSLHTYNIDLEAAERLVSSRTKALIVQHTFGIPVDLDRAVEVARRHGLHLIEDCVHSLGARHRGRPLGSVGRAAFFSTEETKTISSTMGGVAVTNDPGLAAELERFRAECRRPKRASTARYLLKLIAYHLLTQPHIHRYARRAYERLGRPQPLARATTVEEQHGGRPRGYEERLANAQAAVAFRQLRRLDDNLVHRRMIAALYGEELAARGYEVPRPPAEAESAYVRFPVRVVDRGDTARRVAPWAVLGTWFTSVLEESASPDAGGYEAGSCPNAELVARDLVNLPTHPRVSRRDARTIASVLARTRPPAGYARLRTHEAEGRLSGLLT